MTQIRSLIVARAAELLLMGGIVVGVAIALDGAVSRVLNGVGGLLWVAAAVGLLVDARSRPGFRSFLSATVTVCLLLVLAVRPSHLLWAAAGFGLGGAAIAYAGRFEPARAALLLPALWLPVHLGVAVVKAAVRVLASEPARVRTEPPPTAALVPVAMIVAAYLGGAAVRRIGMGRG